MLAPARALALAVPALLLAGAWGFQLIGGFYPCEMCHWQRWAHYAALVPAVLAYLASGSRQLSRGLVLLAGLAILASGAIGIFHAGVEYHWWSGLTRCTSVALGGGDPLKALLAAPLIRCDTAAWTLFGVSMAGFNALFSLAGGIAIWALCLTRPAR
ncbi:disulfide bond formation protein B [Sphingomonas sp. BIUV-7]|uniref:Disulfide bond formation protein B n=2 Tax=Sphingomonas natans TaxID=3063330 RepID=A0ABT8Y6N2_9SPHN|nr:disulfide bond formation protein B [Sphingomonas sp. BIUV-7]MDO6413978.1 disulfide bond formation protein B [Sphingomonas sp. BIUV-7]